VTVEENRPFPLGTVALLLLLVVAAALLAVPTARVPLFYDILGYTSQARSLLEGRGNTIRVGSTDIPGYYPAGLPALLLPPLALLGPDMRHGVWTVLAFALVAVGAVYFAGRRYGGTVAAGLAAGLFLLSSPMFRRMSGYIMTQVPTGAVIVVAALLFARRDRSSAPFLAGLLAMLSLLLRYANLTFPAAMVAAELLTGGSRPRGRWRALLALGAGMALGGLLVAAHNVWAYGGPAETGYAVWSHDLENRFSWRNLFSPEGAPRRPEEHWVLVKALAGFSELQSPVVALAALAGLIVCWRAGRAAPAARAFAALALLTLLVQGLFLALYSFRSDNYLLPGVPITAALAGLGAARTLGARRAWWAPALAAGVLALSLARQAGPSSTEIEAIQRHDSLAAAAALMESDAILITTADPGLAEPLVRGSEPRRALVYLGPFVGPVQGEAAMAELGGQAPTGPHVLAYALVRAAAGRPLYLDQNPPPRELTGDHIAVRKRLHEHFEFVPTAARNVVRLKWDGQGGPVSPHPSGR
jgi:hypothetical protein